MTVLDLLGSATTLFQSLISALVDMLSCAWVQACFGLVCCAFVVTIFKRIIS